LIDPFESFETNVLDLRIFIAPDWGRTCNNESEFEETMTEHENEILKTLCARVSAEQDPLVFADLMTELDALLEKLATRKARCAGFESET
jgi:hypothetical protein